MPFASPNIDCVTFDVLWFRRFIRQSAICCPVISVSAPILPGSTLTSKANTSVAPPRPRGKQAVCIVGGAATSDIPTSTRTPPHLPLCSVEKYPHSHINALTHIYARDSGEIIRPNNRRNNSKHNRFRTYTKGNRTAFRSTARFVGRHTSTSLSPGLGRRLFRPIDSHGKRIAYRSTQRREPRSHHDLEAAAAAQPAHGQQG